MLMYTVMTRGRGGVTTGEHLYSIIKQYLKSHNIPLTNIIGFAADGASNIMGTNNSIVSHLMTKLPGIAILKCMCHTVHLCSSHAAKTLHCSCEDLIRNIYTHFSHSAKRVHQSVKFRNFCNTKPHKLLHISQTRWLSWLLSEY